MVLGACAADGGVRAISIYEKFHFTFTPPSWPLRVDPDHGADEYARRSVSIEQSVFFTFCRSCASELGVETAPPIGNLVA
jgi:hypothetical protein